MSRYNFHCLILASSMMLGLCAATQASAQSPPDPGAARAIEPEGGPSEISVPATAVDVDEVSKMPVPTDSQAVHRHTGEELDYLKLLADTVPVETPPGSAQEDPPGGLRPMAPSFSTDFRGFDAGHGVPPDPHLAVGLDDLVVSVNTDFIVYDKLGDERLRVNLNNWFSNVVPLTTFISDPKVIYDADANRYILVVIACNAVCDQAAANQAWWLVSASQTSSGTGAWWNWALDARPNGHTMTDNWADYPGLGLTSQAVYLTANMVRFHGGFQYAKMRILDKSVVFSGGALDWHDFWNLTTDWFQTVQPAHTYDVTDREFLIGARSSGALNLWEVTCQLCPAPGLNRRTVNVDPYSTAPNARQPGTPARLDTIDPRLYNAVVRNGRLWTAHTVAINWGLGNEAGIRWYEVNPWTGGVVQQRGYGSPGFDYFFPAVVPDRNGNMVMAFARSGPAEFGSVRFTGRRSTDPPGDLQASDLLQAGTASYGTSGVARWGDYYGVAWDPDPFLWDILWMHGEYVRALNLYGTWVGAVTYAW